MAKENTAPAPGTGEIVRKALAIGDEVEINGVGKTGTVVAIAPDLIEVKFVHPASEHRLTELTTFGSYHPDRVSRTLRQTAKSAL